MPNFSMSACEEKLLVQELDAPAQCLFLRLFQRRRDWFRMAALSYTEAPDVDAAVASLVAAGFARTSDAISPEGQSLHNIHRQSSVNVRAAQHQVDDVIELGRTPSWMSSYLTLRRLTPKVLTCMQADPHQQRRSHCQLAACRSACTTHRLARSLSRSLER